MRFLILPILTVCVVPAFLSCRPYSPVERHFLRVPASYAAELSGIDREKWLKVARNNPSAAKLAKEQNYLKLSGGGLAGTARFLPEGKIKFFPDQTGGRQGIIALLWHGVRGDAGPDSVRFWLLRTEGGRYVNQPLTRWLPGGSATWHYRLDEVADSITVWQDGDASKHPESRPLRFYWKGSQWVRE